MKRRAPFSALPLVATVLTLACLLVGVGAASATPPAVQGASFNTTSILGTDLYAEAVAIADLNGDGVKDVVTANHSWDSTVGSVSVMLGNGVGGFSARTDLATDSGAWSVAVGDFNKDGKADLVTANYQSDNVSLLLGTGSGSFGATTDFPTGAGPMSVAVGDFNGDGKQDLVTANADYDTEPNSVSVLLGNGDGGFGAKTDFTTGPAPWSVAVGDFNKDGKQDLVTANSDFGNVSVLLGNGSGGFGAKTDFPTGTGCYSVAVGDFNGDGKQDLVTANYGDNASISVLLGDGDGTFGAALNHGIRRSPYSVAVGDLNGDGKLDIAASDWGAGGVYLLLGDGAGGILAPARFATGAGPYSVAVSDFNEDGRQDLVTANNGADTVSVLLGNGSGGFGAKNDFTTGAGPRSVAVGDFNGDGKADLATANYGSNSVSILLGNGSGGFGAKTDYASSGMGFAEEVRTTDLNADGKQDLVVACLAGLTVFLGKGDGTFPEGLFISTSHIGTPANADHVAVGDFNEDNNQDVAFVGENASNILGVLLGDGTGQLGSPTLYSTDTQPGSIAVCDLDGDGHQDLVTANDVYYTASVFYGDGTGHFDPKVDLDLGGYGTAGGPMGAAVDDFNSDGWLDVASSMGAPGSVSVVVGGSQRAFEPYVEFEVGPYLHSHYTSLDLPSAVALGDFNGDGSPDIATALAGSASVCVLLNTSPTGPPMATLTSSTHPDSSRWYANNTPTLAWSASDPSGVSSYQYTLDHSATSLPDTTWTTTTATPPPTSKTYGAQVDGVWCFHIRARNNAGLWGQTKTRIVRIDTNPPTTSATGADAAWHNAPVTVTLTATDAASGMSGGGAKTEYKLDSAASWTTGTSVTIAAPGTHANDGTHTISYRSTDAVGNLETVETATVKIDTVDPSAIDGLVCSTHAVQTTWYANKTPGFTWSASSDATSGIAGYSFVLDRSASTAPDASTETAGLSYTSPVRTDGVWYFHVRAVDAAGNVGATSHYIVRIDTRPPTTRAPYTETVIRGRYVRLHYRVGDLAPNGGTAKVTIRIKTLGGKTVKQVTFAAKPVNTLLYWRFRCKLAKKTYRFFVYATDAAGNKQANVASNRLIVK